jgi:hypothetical protein
VDSAFRLAADRRCGAFHFPSQDGWVLSRRSRRLRGLSLLPAFGCDDLDEAEMDPAPDGRTSGIARINRYM